MIFLYVGIAIFLEVLYIIIAQKVLDFWNGYFVVRKIGVRVPVNWIIVYMTVALFLFALFHLTVIIFAFVVLE